MQEIIMKRLLNNINKYYTDKILHYGPSPKGVDWKDEESQCIRFEQLLKVIGKRGFFILNDLGCGYGKLYDFILKEDCYTNFTYIGYDLSEEMIRHAGEGHKTYDNCKFLKIDDSDDLSMSDYTVASGIFNVRLDHTYEEWLGYVVKTIKDMNQNSKKGFAFNCLTKYADKDYMRDDLYYADPCYFFDYCKKNFSRNVALLHDYGLYEFTILVRKE